MFLVNLMESRSILNRVVKNSSRIHAVAPLQLVISRFTIFIP